MNQSYFYAKKIDGNIETKGSDKCSLGHKIYRGENKKPDGIFAEWLWDGNKLIAQNDRYGMHPLFYYSRNNEICISPSIPRLLKEGADSELDYNALAVYLRIGFFIGEDTPFKYIRAVPPDAGFKWQNGSLEISGSYHFSKRNEHISYEDALDNYIFLFRKSIEKGLPFNENFALPLSGGKDSRHILLELNKLGFKPKYCVTVEAIPPYHKDDARIAKLVAQALNIDHVTIKQQGSYFKSQMETYFLTNFCTDEHAHFWAMNEYLKGNAEISYDWIGGDVLSSSGFLNSDMLSLFEKKQLTALAETIFNKFNSSPLDEEYIRRVISNELYPRINRELAMEHLIEELNKHTSAHNPVTSFYFWNRTRREISLSPFGILSDIPTVFCPYLDHDLYDFLTSLHPRFSLSRRFHADAIERAYPEFAHVPYVEKNVPYLNPNRMARRFVKEFCFYLLKNARQASKIMRTKYIIPRLIYSYFKGGCYYWFRAVTLMLYLIELHKLKDSKGAWSR